MLKVNGYGRRQAKVNEKGLCFKGWKTLVLYLTLRLSSISFAFDGNFSTLRTKAVLSSYIKVKYPLCSHSFNTGSILSLSVYIIGGKLSHVQIGLYANGS